MADNLLKNNGLARWIWRFWTPLLIVQVIAFAASITFTHPYFMTYDYKSYAIVYPYNMNTFSKESSTEQMLEFLNSVEIKNDVIRKFNLIRHYKIDTTKRYYYTKLLDKYDDNVIVGNTEYEAVKVTVYDRSNDTACQMVKEILNSLNAKLLATQKEKSVETMQMYKVMLDKKKREMDSLAAISKQLSVQYGIVDYGNQSREVVRAYYQMTAASKAGKPLEEAATQIKNLEEKGEEYNAVNLHLKSTIDEYDAIVVKYDEAVRDVNKQITYTNVVAAPYPADKKTYPVRWLIILGTCLSAFIFSYAILKLLEKSRN